MKYRVSHVPNSGHGVNFKMCNEQGKHESFFTFSHELIDVWGNPLEAKLKELMIAYVKRHGWVKEPVTMTDKNSPRSLQHLIASLPKAKA